MSVRDAVYAVYERRLRTHLVGLPVPQHVAKHVDEARALYDLVKQQDRNGADGIVQFEKSLSRLELEADGDERDPYGEGSFPRPQDLPDKKPTA